MPAPEYARFIPVVGQVNKGVGAAYRPLYPVKLLHFFYSVRDTAGTFNPTTTAFSMRVAIVRGVYGGDPTTFDFATDLSAWGGTPLLDIVVASVFGNFQFIPDEGSGAVYADPGEGFTILFGIPHGTTTFVTSFQAIGGSVGQGPSAGGGPSGGSSSSGFGAGTGGGSGGGGGEKGPPVK